MPLFLPVERKIKKNIKNQRHNPNFVTVVLFILSLIGLLHYILLTDFTWNTLQK